MLLSPTIPGLYNEPSSVRDCFVFIELSKILMSFGVNVGFNTYLMSYK